MSKSVLFASFAQGFPTTDNFSLREDPKPVLSEEGSILVKILFASVDPYMRGRMNPVAPIYTTPFKIGEPLDGFAVGEVVESKNEKYPVGTFVSGNLTFSEYVILNDKTPFLAKVSLPREQLSNALGVVGMPGLTAYFGLHELTQPKAGETLVVSGAAGAVGSYVVQLGKQVGLKVIGIAGSDEKCKVLRDELGADATINYKTENVASKLKELTPNGVDIYFDNVGGEISDVVIWQMNIGGRIASCGAISEYNKADSGPRPWLPIIIKGLSVRGFVVFREFGSKWQQGTDHMSSLFKEGKIKAKETVVEGIENLPKALIQIFEGGNIGKQVVKF